MTIAFKSVADCLSGTYGYGGQIGTPRTVGGTLRVTL